MKKPIGAPITIAPAVPYMLVSINGRIPKDGGFPVESHYLFKIKSLNPISRIAGIPDIIRYIVISSTDATVTSPSIRNTPWMIVSSSFFLFFITVTPCGKQTAY